MGAMNSRADVEALRAQLIDPALVCAALGLVDGARTQPKGLMIRCPWHRDTNPSCSVTIGSDGTLRVKCFACGESADAFGLIARVRGLDVKRAFPAVLSSAAQIVNEIEGSSSAATPPKEVLQTKLSTEEFDLLARTMLESSPLSASPKGSEYLSRRGLLDAAKADGWGALAETRSGVATVVTTIIAAVGEDVWKSSGMCNESGEITFPANVLLVPWRDTAGAVTTIQRRALDPDAKGHKYVFPAGRSPTFPYGIEKILPGSDGADLAFVEGASDTLAYRALCARDRKLRVVLGLPGVSAWRVPWAEYARGRVAHVALDADEAGDRAAERIAVDLHRAGALRVLRQRPRGAKDWAEILERSRP
jgi:DNA primase